MNSWSFALEPKAKGDEAAQITEALGGPADDATAQDGWIMAKLQGAAEQGKAAARPPPTASISGKASSRSSSISALPTATGSSPAPPARARPSRCKAWRKGFSDQGVPVFCADVKGDLSGLAEAASPKPWIEARAKEIGFTHEFRAYPVIFWDLFGEQGHPIRTTVSEMGPLLLSRLMDLSEAQEGVLNIAFKIADDEKLPLLHSQGFASAARGLAARADSAHHEIRQHHQGVGRLDPTLAARARAARWRRISSASLCSTSRTSC